MAKKKKNKLAVSDIVRRKIPYVRCFEEEGIIETRPNQFSKCYLIDEVDPVNAQDYTVASFNKKFKALLNTIPEDMSIQFVIHNKLVNNDFFFEKVLKDPKDAPDYSDYIDSYNDVIIDNADVGHNNVKKDTYFAISIKADLPEIAVKRFREIDSVIKDLFQNIYGINANGIGLKSKLKVLYTMLNANRDDFGRKVDIKGNGNFDFKNMTRLGLTTKDIVAPNSIDNKESHKDYLILNGDTYVRTFFINLIPRVISNSFISDITSISSNMLLSIQYDHIPTEFGFGVFSDNVASNMKSQTVKRRESFSDRKNHKTEEKTQMINYTEQDYFNNSAIKVFKEGKATETNIYACSVVISLYAEDLETLNRDTKLLYISTNKFAVQVKSLDLQQLEGLQSCLPLCDCRVDVKRVLNLDKLAMMHPLNIQEILKKDGLFNGLNAINDNLIFLNRKNFSNPSGIIAGVEHCGKTYQNKREIFNGLISSKDRVCIVTTSDDYDDFVKKLNGVVIENPLTNIFECVEYYGLLTNALYSKSLMLEALFKELYLQSLANSVDISKIEDEKDAVITSDVQRLLDLAERKALDFNDVTSVIGYIESHIQSFEFIPEIFTELKKMCGIYRSASGRVELYKVHSTANLIAVLNYLWNRAIKDMSKNIQTQLFIDPIDGVLASENGLDYINEYIDKCTKFKAIITMVVQSSVKLMSNSKTTIRLEELINACGYFKLLNQGAIERKKYSEMLNIPNSLINYITNVDYGKGLILTPSSNIAFDDNFLEEDNEFYKLFA